MTYMFILKCALKLVLKNILASKGLVLKDDGFFKLRTLFIPTFFMTKE